MRHCGGMRHVCSNRPVHDGSAVRVGRDLRSVHSAHSYGIMEMILIPLRAHVLTAKLLNGF